MCRINDCCDTIKNSLGKFLWQPYVEKYGKEFVSAPAEEKELVDGTEYILTESLFLAGSNIGERN